MTDMSNDVEESQSDVAAALDRAIVQLYADVAILTEQKEELERLGRAIVNTARGGATNVLVRTELVSDMNTCLDRIWRHKTGL